MADEEEEQFNDLKPFESNPNPSSLESEVTEDDESGVLEELGRELERIARRILYFRRTFPDEFSMTFSSLLA
ncbi:hypothetical protein QJS10_CPA06g00297 [Acorus calamus]|uniref:Uncharacterized protein n=1 Tax=Acorus calamus TaxID=4465 RepID=A0AAV9EQU0_ACOCL|nr:hypothetical protein QJS10_CPA06g00297 [Acorus calamus]